MSKLKDFFKKYFTKTTLTIALVAVVGLGIYINYNMRSKLAAARSELLSSQALYSIVEKEKVRLDSLVIVYTASIKNMDERIAIKDKQIAAQYKAIHVLQDSIKNTLADVQNVTADSSYKYINLRLPPVAPLVFPFDSTQVKAIHYTLLERDGLFEVSAKQETLITDFKITSSLKDLQILDLKGLNNIYVAKENIYKKESEAYQIQIQSLNKTVKQQKFLKTVSNSAVVGLAGYLIIHSIVAN